MDRNEREVAGVPIWAWEVLEEEPPWRPGLMDKWDTVEIPPYPEHLKTLKPSEIDKLKPEEIPLYDPHDGRTVRRTTQAPKAMLEAFRDRISVKELAKRAGQKWISDAGDFPPEGREVFWTRRIEAINLHFNAGSLDVKERPDMDESTEADLNELLDDLQQRANVARTLASDIESAARAAGSKPKARYSTPGWKRAIVDVFLDSDNNFEPRMADDKLVWETIKFAQELFRRAEKSPFAPIRTKNQDGDTVKNFMRDLSPEERGGPWPGRGEGIMAAWFRLAHRWRREWEASEKGDGTISHN